MTVEELRETGWIAYEYIRGSHAYGINTETSDIDIGGVYICPKNSLYGLRCKYEEQVSDKKHDVVFYEFGRWIELLLKSNPSAIESLFMPKRCVIGNVHPMVQYVIDHRDMFLSKRCISALTGYASEQIYKAKGLNKKINAPINVTERKGILDFTYTNFLQGSIKVEDRLDMLGLNQKYCGLVKVPHMDSTFSVFYDFGSHCANEANWENNKFFLRAALSVFDPSFYNTTNGEKNKITNYSEHDYNRAIDWLKQQFPIGYRGMVKEKEDGESTKLRLSSIPNKHSLPIFTVTYNENGFKTHCRQFKEYEEWVKERNEARYQNNLGHNYDSKNMSHCMRLVRMGKELAQGKGFIVDRSNIDRDYLLSIKNHELSYDEILEQVNNEMEEMKKAVEVTSLPEEVDIDTVNNLLIQARISFYDV